MPFDPDSHNADFHTWAFFMEPIFTQSGDTWTAAYPEADWSVTGTSRADALENLIGEVIQRQIDNRPIHPVPQAEIYRRHLETPIPGVYAMDNGLYAELIEAEAGEPEIMRVFAEAERHRVAGHRYTAAEYRAANEH